jgi:hypothetical protein
LPMPACLTPPDMRDRWAADGGPLLHGALARRGACA